jgi:hypothetical protein
VLPLPVDAFDVMPLPVEPSLTSPLPSDPALAMPVAVGIGGGGNGAPISNAVIEKAD